MDPSELDLRTNIAEILKDADLDVMTVKKIRLQLEVKFDKELLDRKKEIDGLVMQMLLDRDAFNNDSSYEDRGGCVSSDKAAKLQSRLTKKIMALSKAVLSSSIAEILKGADLDTITAKKVRLDLEKKFRTDLLSRKQEINDIVMEMLTANANKTDDSEEVGSEESETEAPPPKKAKPNARANQKKSKKAKEESSDEEDEPEENDEENEDSDEKSGDEALARKMQKEELQSRTRAAKKSSKPAKGAKTAAKSPKKAPGGGKKNNSGFTREYNLSEELAAVVGAPTMARHAVVKKIWEVVKEKNLYDPTDKRFAICNDELMSVFRIKRFRTFSMMKYLSKHFLEPS